MRRDGRATSYTGVFVSHVGQDDARVECAPLAETVELRGLTIDVAMHWVRLGAKEGAAESLRRSRPDRIGEIDRTRPDVMR